MIGGLDYVQGRSRSEAGANGTQKFEIGEGVARSLEEEHRLFDVTQMFGTFGPRLVGRVEREAVEYQSSNVG